MFLRKKNKPTPLRTEEGRVDRHSGVLRPCSDQGTNERPVQQVGDLTDQESIESAIDSENVHLQLLQVMADSAVQNAEELATKLRLAVQIKEEAEAEAERIKKEANKQAKQIIGNSRIKAEAEANEVALEVKRKAEAETEKLKSEANEQVQEIIAKTQREAEVRAEKELLKVRVSAEEKAGQIRANAQKRARKIIAASVRKARAEARSEAEQESLTILKAAELRASEESLAIKMKAEVEAIEESSKIVKRAEAMADRRIEDAKQKIEKIMEEGRREAEVQAEEESTSIKKKAKLDADRMVKDANQKAEKIVVEAQKEAEVKAKEEFDRIKKESKAEAEKLIEDANQQARDIISKARIAAEEEAKSQSAQMLQQAQQRAIEIEAEAIKEVAQTKMRAKEEIENQLYHQVVGKVGEKYDTSEEMPTNKTGEKTSTKGECADDKNGVAEEATKNEVKPELIPENDGKVVQSDTGYKAQQALKKSPPDITANPVSPQEYFDGLVEIDMQPPIDVARLLEIKRELEETQGIKILQTSGSLESIIAMVVSSDDPIPLADILRDMPDVEDVQIDKQGQFSENIDTMPPLIMPSGQDVMSRIFLSIKGKSGKEAKK